MKLYNDTDKVVKLRQGMAMILQEGADRINNGTDTDFMKRALKRISSYDSYSLELDTKSRYLIDGKYYGGGDKTIVIRENRKRIFTIYKDKRDGDMKLDVNPLDLVAIGVKKPSVTNK